MKHKNSKHGMIKRFFMWLFRVKTVETVEIPKTKSEPIPTSFENSEKKGKDVPFPVVKSKIEKRMVEINNEKMLRKKMNLSDKYNPNVTRGANGRFKSLNK